MLIGLAAKNAILIVEFAKMKYEAGVPLIEASLEGARLRLRPILMTSFAFILGCVPLALASGAGALSRQVMGYAVIGGMMLASFVAVFLIPVCYYVVERFKGKPKPKNRAVSGRADGESRAWLKERDAMKHSPCIASALASVFAFSGCAVGPNYKASGSGVTQRVSQCSAHARDLDRECRLVGDLPRYHVAGADPRSADKELRSASGGGACGTGASVCGANEVLLFSLPWGPGRHFAW
jgi:hypothetical protein